MISSFGTFTYSTAWANDYCRASCHVTYGGNYQSTSGFAQSHCNGNIQSSDYIGFWCNWSTGDGAVMMIGGGGSSCHRADHGIGITEGDSAAFDDTGNGECDFGYDYGNDVNIASTNDCTPYYSLNLWIK